METTGTPFAAYRAVTKTSINQKVTQLEVKMQVLERGDSWCSKDK